MDRDELIAAVEGGERFDYVFFWQPDPRQDPVGVEGHDVVAGISIEIQQRHRESMGNLTKKAALHAAAGRPVSV